MTPPPRHLLLEWGSTKIEKTIVKHKENHEATTSMQENDQTRPQATSQIAESSSTMTSEEPRNAVTTSISVAKNHWVVGPGDH